MRVHEYSGEHFCVTLIDGDPCLGSQSDETIHVQPLGSQGASTRETLSWMALPTTWRYVIVRDAGVFRRYAAWARMTLPEAIEDLKAERFARPQERVWIEDRKVS